MIKKFFAALVVVLFATTMMAQTGLTCDDPIPVGKNYEGKVDGPCTRWYVANTYDLPLHVYFIPDSADSEVSPELYVDFSCTPGVYADSKLDSLINKMSIFGVELPIEFMCDLVTYQGRNAWELYISNSYREELSESGITYNVPAFVQVNFFESGSIAITPDTIFNSCIDNSEHIILGDTLEILPNDSNRVFVLPYTDWKKDSIRYVWLGEETARVWLATDDCGFTPSTMSSYVWSYYDVSQDQPYKLQAADIKSAIDDSNNGGIFFGKVLSPVAGKMVIEKIPLTPPAGGAILLEYDEPVSVSANTETLFAFPKTWNSATMFQPSVECAFQVEMCNSPRFVDSTGVYVNTYTSTTYDEYAVHLTSLDMASNTKNAKDKYIYVRFIADQDIQVTPRLWNVSPCIDSSRPIWANQSFKMSSAASSYYYRIKYDEYAGYDLTINWAGSSRMSVYIGDTCKFANSASNAHVIHNKTITAKTSYVIPAETVDSWVNRVDGDGYLYVRFSSVTGDITFQTEKPAPVYSPCVLASTLLEPTTELVINLNNAFDVYRIDYNAWMQQAVTLEWTGIEPLHAFVAETCEFALAPYNRYVHAYVPVPAQGDWVLDMDALAQYVDEDGYLYVRFLTEFDGTLKVGR